MRERLSKGSFRSRQAVALLALGMVCAAFVAPSAMGQQSASTRLPGRDDPRQGGIIDRVLVRVNGDPILQSELDGVWDTNLPVWRRQFREEEIAAQEPEIRRSMLMGMVEERLVLQRADDLGIEASANDVDRTLNRLREANGLVSDEAFEQALAADGLTVAELRDQLRKNFIRQRLIFEEVQRQIFVAEHEVTTYYEENRDGFRTPAQVLHQQIVFLLQGQDAATVLRTAQAALAELRGGFSMSAVAAKYDGAQLAGGDEVSWVALEDMVPELAAALEDMAPGGYSEPIETVFGYHIIQLLDRRDELVQPIEEVEREIRQTLMQQKQQERFETYTAELREDSDIQVLAAEYTGLLEAWENAGTATPSDERR